MPDDERRPIEEAHRAVLEAVEWFGRPGPPEEIRARFEAATEFEKFLRGQSSRMADVRARLVERIWNEGELSLAELAGRISVTKQRAYELLNRARGKG